jgi:hypothetical protein
VNRGEIWLYTFKPPDKRILERRSRALAIATGCGN